MAEACVLYDQLSVDFSIQPTTGQEHLLATTGGNF